MNKIKKSSQNGFTLIELMTVVAIIGILSVLAIFAVTKYLKAAKASEATNSLGAMQRMAVQAYEKERGGGEILADGATSTIPITHQLCPSSTAAIPATPPAGKKYQAAATEWAADPGMRCLGFSITEPQYFSYDYIAGAPSNIATLASMPIPATGWGVGAKADLAGDGKFLQFATGGDVRNGQPTTATSINSWDEGTNSTFD